jgi:hypothetical protein
MPSTACCRKIANGVKKMTMREIDYAGSGMAIETLIDSIVRVTIRHSDNEPIASEAATAPANLEEETGACGRSKLTAPGDRIMVEILQGAGESPATP